MITIKPRYGKITGASRLCWYCRNFNITTTGDSREKCVKRHLQKLKAYGFIRSENSWTPVDTIAREFCKSPWKNKEV